MKGLRLLSTLKSMQGFYNHFAVSTIRSCFYPTVIINTKKH